MILTLKSSVNHTIVSGLFITSNDVRKGKNNPSQNRNISYIISISLVANQQDVNHHSLIYHFIMRLDIFLR